MGIKKLDINQSLPLTRFPMLHTQFLLDWNHIVNLATDVPGNKLILVHKSLLAACVVYS
jgi:hypothetical protein